MKKIISFIVAFATLLGIVGSFHNNTDALAVEAADKASAKNEVVLCDFEQWIYDFSLLRAGEFWSITKSSEQVASGKYSAKLVPGGYYDNSQPIVYVPLTSAKYGFNYNLAEYWGTTAKLYNTAEEDINIKIGIKTKAAGKCLAVDYTLKPGWNSVSYSFDHNIINMYNGSMEDIQSIWFQFEPCVSRVFEDSNVIYLDDVKLIKMTTEIEVVDIVKLDKYEIADFEKAYQQYAIGWHVYQDVPPVAEIVDIRKGELPEGVIPTSGHKCLKVTTHAREDGYQAYPRLILKDLVVAKAINALTEEEKANASICFDIYGENSGWKYDIAFKDTVSKQLDSGSWTVSFWGAGTSAKQGEWTTFRFKLSDIDAEERDASVGRGQGADFTNNPDSILLIWPDYAQGDDRIFYLDNVRIEIGEGGK